MKFVSRSDAGLRPARGRTSLNVSVATAHWGGDGPGALDHDECAATWRAWQAQHMDTSQLAPNGAVDIAYNAGVCQHGFVFEGRGQGARSAANGTNEGNSSSYAVVYIGGSEASFTDDAKHGFNDAAEWLGASLDWGHRDWTSTGCPGDEIYEWVHRGHPRPDGSEEDEMTPEERDALRWLQDMMRKLTAGFADDDYEAAERLNAAVKAGTSGSGASGGTYTVTGTLNLKP